MEACSFVPDRITKNKDKMYQNLARRSTDHFAKYIEKEEPAPEMT